MNWIQLLQVIAAIAAPLVTSIEQIHAGKTGAEKKAAALDAIGLGDVAARYAAPAQQPLFDATAQLASVLIDEAVQDQNASGAFTHKPAVKAASAG